ncbi:hypothetical protein Mal52_09900 [Symmachiella dynata]|uniref:DUF3500 domain-containing protein n=1 Tax=Symmachiella dynata TaxID=2527995 RepID=A0A517ZJC4_9PLAN|nr:DUF3500 domain-containing protein [Symmachiella dynata]QDU42527.1 hypothetical protein Mal52_09900 [Symmachiella dynata]
MTDDRRCPDVVGNGLVSLSRREFVSTVGAAATVASAVSLPNVILADEKKPQQPESLVKKLYGSLSETQRKQVCFDWDHVDDERGLLRSRVANNWQITDKEKYNVASAFYTKDQQEMIEAIFYGLYSADWKKQILKQLKDDAGGYGKQQTIAIFGQPDTGKFEFVMTGRHLTVRCDGDSADHVAFGGPIFYGHAAQSGTEAPDHPGNVYWHQAMKANALYKMLDGKQRKVALVEAAPEESAVDFQGKQGGFDGIRISELSRDQKEHAQGVLKTLLEPYRDSDQVEAMKLLDKQGGLDNCHLAFYQSEDIGDDGVWDIWRLEGPSFVWHFRGAPHVHVWVNVADDASVELNA